MQEAPGTAPPNPSVMYVITDLDHGGAENQVVELAARFVSRGWRVHVVSLMEPEAFVEELTAAGARVSSLGMRRGVADPRSLLALARLYREHAPDVVHSHMVHANIAARLARLLTPVPFLISTAHNVVEGGPALELAYRVTDPMAELTTNVSLAGVERYLRVGATVPSKSMFVANGIDVARFTRSAEARSSIRGSLGLGAGFVWLAVGRFAEAKDYPNMIRALARAGTDSTLLIAGQGDLREATETLAKELGVFERVWFLGLRRDIAALASAADAFVMSSSWEGLPIALLEATACGLPAVSTDVGGIAQVVRPDTGRLVPPHDSEALAEAMRFMEGLPSEHLTSMGAAARETTVATFDIERVVDTWEALYRQGLGVAGSSNHRLAMRAWRPTRA